ncbi:MAG: dockerin type I repeat-containing protein [Tyzzerella sp.]|nr:dockerin type I repeat-containing protein [Tyzzerella sp.]
MKTMGKRLIAVLCCVVLFVTSLYISKPQKAEAAATGTMSLVCQEYGYAGYLNISYTLSNATYTGIGDRFLNDAFVNQYVKFGGGMTRTNLITEHNFAYVANDNVLQINWNDASATFQPGWSFTIAQGALIPINGSSAYVALDKEYTFTFRTETQVVVTGCYTTTFSLGNLGIWGNGAGTATSQLGFTDSNVANFQTIYQEIQMDQTYADYIQFDNFKYSELESKNVVLKYILDGSARCIQITNWGELRNTMTKGSQMIFRKGLPIYYTSTDGTQCKATLDATYVYECDGSNSDNTQVFYGVKIDDSTPKYGLNIQSQTTGPQGAEQYINVGFDYATVSAGVVQTYTGSENILNDKVAETYLQIAGYTVEQAKAMGIAIRYIPSADVIQMGFESAAVAALKVGDTIVLKKGMPVVYMHNGVLCAAVLDAEYTFEVTANNGTNLTFSRYLSDTYSFTGTVSGPGNEGGYNYYGMPIAPDEFEDIQTRTEAVIDPSIWQSYVVTSKHKASDFTTDGSFLKFYGYTPDVFQGIRLYTNVSFTNGEQLVIKKGFPITYNTSVANYSDGSGVKTKMTCLDKDYGFVYNSSTGSFTYDPSLNADSIEKQEADTFTFSSSSVGTFPEGGLYKTNIHYTTEATLTSDASQTSIINNEETLEYLDICGIDIAALRENGVDIRFIPSAGCFQFVLGSSLDWLQVGEQITFKAGMPVCYMSNGVETKVVLEETAVYTITNVDTTSSEQTATFVRYAETAEFAINTDAPLSTAGASNLAVINSTTGEQDVLDDMTTGQYVWLDKDTIVNYIDFFGMTKEEIEAYGVEIALICDGGNEVMQIQWNDAAGKLSKGQRLILKKGLPFTYKTTNNLQKKITLDKDYIFEVTEASTASATLKYTDVQIGGTWGLIFGQEYGTGYGTGEGYYNNLSFSSCDLMNDMASPEGFSAETISKYIVFGGISPSNYSQIGINAIPVLNNDAQVVQLRWGSATDSMKAGDEIVFKKGMPIIATDAQGVKRLYTLDSDYTFVLVARDDLSQAANGYVLTGMKEVSKITEGDVDGDFLLNTNDVTLVRKQLVDLVNAKLVNADANNDGEINSKDLVHAKVQWDKEEPESYTTVFKQNGDFSTLANGATVTYTIDADVSSANYIRLTFNTTQNLYGTIVYQTAAGTDYKENFYVSKDEVQFEQFFDYYRNISPTKNNANAKNAVIKTITFKNVGAEQAKVLLNEVEIANRTDFVTDDMLWIQNDNLKVGADLNMGGSLGYMESLKYNPVEKVGTFSTTIEVGNTSGTVYGKVNLINIYDLGRQIQQAYYIDVQDAEYENGTFNVNYQDVVWPYNPVQAGDKNNNQSQVIDFRVIDTDEDGSNDMIYVKVRGLDWGKNAETTESYFENWYRISDNQLYVDNAFVDWAGWKNTGAAKAQELPALYTAQSLSYFVDGDDPSKRTTPGNWASTNPDDYFFESDANVADWYAWVNKDADDAFGVGIYIPGVSQCTAGRPKTSTSKYTNQNKNADDAEMLDLGYAFYRDKLYQHQYQNCFLMNTSYIAPGKVATVQEYRSYEYSYVLTADKLDQMQTAFETISANDTVKNASLSSW